MGECCVRPWAALSCGGSPLPEDSACRGREDTEQGGGDGGAGSRAWQNLETRLDFGLVSYTLSMALTLGHICEKARYLHWWTSQLTLISPRTFPDLGGIKASGNRNPSLSNPVFKAW